MGLAGVRPHGLLEDPHPGASGSEGHLKWVLSSLGTIDPPPTSTPKTGEAHGTLLECGLYILSMKRNL